MRYEERLKLGDVWEMDSHSHRSQTLKINYDPEEDILYIIVKEGSIFDSKEIDEDIRLEYDRKGEVAGLEIMNARKNIAKTFAREIAEEIGTPNR